MHEPKHFFSLVQHGFSGAVLGLFGGLILAIVVSAILMLATRISGSSGDASMPMQMVLLMGMGWGSVLGAIFGSLMRLKK